MSLLIPPVFYGVYAITKYQLPQQRMLPTVILSGLIIGGMVKAGLYSSTRDTDIYYKKLYE